MADEIVENRYTSNRDPKMQRTPRLAVVGWTFFLLLLVDITILSGVLKGRYTLFLRGFSLLVYIFSVRMLFSKYTHVLKS